MTKKINIKKLERDLVELADNAQSIVEMQAIVLAVEAGIIEVEK